MLLRGGGKNNSSEEGNNIVLPKYVFAGYYDNSSPSPSSPSSPSIPSKSNPDEGGAPAIFHGTLVSKVFEIDYSGKIVDIIHIKDEEFNNLSEEEVTNLMQFTKDYTTNPNYNDLTKQWNTTGIPVYLYTKEQIDIINKDSIVQLYEGTITKFDDNICIDILDVPNSMEVLSDIQRGQYYCIITKKEYDEIINMQPLPESIDTEPGR